ncbi:iron-containing alcohol dehydrogenase [Vagococcus humatus]|uniref:Alcohol dehydrogenase n=1 Tax=Vagococcus humatus TaxID=1889241 RepID=A0A429Z4C5_9ENTE|nr:iron-containing alcohol dehydrogenase [Vagococcus humatus]RST88551.1 alcohol dehydrogenase [Vagococcus humatus]
MNIFEMPQKLVYGKDALKNLGDCAKQHGDKVLIVSDQVMEKLGYLDTITKNLEQAGLQTVSYLGANTEPSDIYVDEALTLFNDNQCEVIVTVGGGSCIDTAKAVAVVATNGGYIGDYMKDKIATKAPVPLIAIPTTAGTGSEVTDVTVINDTTHHIKMMIKQSAFLPKVALVDPALTLTSPQNVTAATGLDALCHSMESYFSRKAQPMTQTFSLAAIEKIMSYLEQAYQDGSNFEARNAMSLAATQAGLAFSNASVTLIHGMSRPIGSLFHVPHGISNAMLLPAVLDYTRDAAIEPLSEIQHHLHPEETGTSAELADRFIQSVKELCQKLAIPNLKDWGIEEKAFEDALDKMAEDALASGSPSNNPKIPTHDEIVELYRICYTYKY